MALFLWWESMMRKTLLTAMALGAAVLPASAMAQSAPVAVISGTRLDISATGEVTRVPDLAIISAGVQTLQPTATIRRSVSLRGSTRL